MANSTTTAFMAPVLNTLASPPTFSVRSSQPPSSQQSVVSYSQLRDAQAPTPSQRARNKGPSFRKPQGVVTINVGEGEDLESFVVHLHLLQHYSPYFAAAFSPPHLEAETKTMSFPDICPDTFGLITHWLYTQQLDLIPQDQAANVVPLANLWCLAAKFKIAKLQNKVMSWLQPITEGLQGEALKGFFCFVYELDGLVESGKEILKTLAVDRMAWGVSAKALGTWIQGGYLPEDMVVDVLMALRGERSGGGEQVRKVGARDYFVPAEGEVVTAKAEIVE